jgi:DNA-binding NarL/FixJ family response regulator
MEREVKRVLLVENDGGMIRSVKDAIERDPKLDFACYVTGRADLDTVLEAYTPDVALVDLGLLRPGEGMQIHGAEHSTEEGLWIIVRISDRSPQTRIIGFSEYFVGDAALTKKALEKGADAVIAKQNGPSDWNAWSHWLCTQIHSVLDGWWRMSPEVARLFFGDDQRRRSAAETALPLTCRQMEVMQLLALDKNNAEIAQKLCIEEGAVRGHISKIKTRLHMTHRWELVDEARRRGLGGSPSPAT